ncbi:DUF6622 family protein [Ideonella sp. BN130291]|uniref:DUF6622 family protein n=1 Tax=Ideonella sp. BN130291 TaxID=3112940 RepID=UPI002E271D3B|nr:DUF6622 family protein [Ideonella sp. BN130291]
MSQMLIQILTHTPRWVFGLFLVLLALGVQQLFTRQVTLRRVSLLPVVMTGLSVWGVISAFAMQPLALPAWMAGAVLAGGVLLQFPLPAGVRYDAASRRFQLPGSAVPLALMMGVFFTKYAVGVTLAQAPELAFHGGFSLGLSALYGLFTGLFVGRAARLWRLAVGDAVTPHTVAA